MDYSLFLADLSTVNRATFSVLESSNRYYTYLYEIARLITIIPVKNVIIISSEPK